MLMHESCCTSCWNRLQGFLEELIFALADIVSALVGELRDLRMEETLIVDQLLTRSGELWDIIWSKRILLQRGTISDLSYPKAIESLNFSWNAMIDW